MIPTAVFPDTTLVVSPHYAGSVALYAAMTRYGSVAMDFTMPWDKRRKESHRTVIGGANGCQRLTVPVVHPDRYHGTTMGDILVSDHGRWWELHRGAIESAYGRTPYYEYYADDLNRAFTGEIDTLRDLDLTIHRFCCQVLGLSDVSGCNLPGVDCSRDIPPVIERPYWQVWSDRFGFQPGLSVLDLIFSEGPGAAIHLASLFD